VTRPACLAPPSGACRRSPPLPGVLPARASVLARCSPAARRHVVTEASPCRSGDHLRALSFRYSLPCQSVARERARLCWRAHRARLLVIVPKGTGHPMPVGGKSRARRRLRLLSQFRAAFSPLRRVRCSMDGSGYFWRGSA
jgi:hypothetical protein